MNELSDINFYMAYKIPPRGKGKKLKWTRTNTKSKQLIDQQKLIKKNARAFKHTVLPIKKDKNKEVCQ